MRLFAKEKKFTVEEMIEMENELRLSELCSLDLNPDDEDLFEKLRLKVEYVDDMDDDNEAELLPIEDDYYLGLIRLRKELKKYKFAYSHEIIHYIFDIGYGRKVDRTFARKRKGKTESIDEQRTNYKAAAYIMPCIQITESLRGYDKSHPRADELKFLKHLQQFYGQSEEAVIRRIREVRKLTRAGYC